jgi:hypothetical protein
MGIFVASRKTAQTRKAGTGAVAEARAGCCACTIATQIETPIVNRQSSIRVIAYRQSAVENDLSRILFHDH